MKILVIEDDLRLQKGLVQLLSEEGFAVDAVGDGEEGLYRAREWHYDLVILDVMLPGLSGWQVVDRLRQEKKTPIIMLTAISELDQVVKGLELGADEFLTKPYHERELVARIRAITRRSQGLARDEIDLGRVIVNMRSNSVHLDDAPINLTATEYRIIEYLALRIGQVISRGELLESIVGEDEASMSNLIDVHIYNIRRKLGKNFLHNRRGLGYVIPLR